MCKGPAMSCYGTVRNGRVELPPETVFPEGTVVRIEEIPANSEIDPAYRLHELAVDADLPPDFASEHDHYAYGTPKRRG